MQNYHITLENVECIAWTTYTIFICTFLHFCSLTAPFLFHFHYMQKSSMNILSNITFCYPQKSYRFGQAFLGELSLSFQVLFQSMNVQSIMTAEVWLLPEVSNLENSPSPRSSCQPELCHLSGLALLRLLKVTLSDTGVRLWKETPHCQARSAIAVIVSDHWFQGRLEPGTENAPSILLSIRKLQNDPPLTPV